MKPGVFDFCRVATFTELSALLTRGDVVGKLIAGGQSLGPMLNLRLAQPDLLVDITAIPELTDVTEERAAIRIGACVTHADVEDQRVPDVTQGFLPRIAAGIAYRAVRNRGTLGGSLAHADPAADWISALSLLGASVEIRGGDAGRRLPVEALMTGSFTTVLRPHELIEAICVPRLDNAVRWGFHKLNRKPGEFALALAGVLHDPERERLRAVIGALEAAPIVLSDARALLPDGPHGTVDARALDAVFDAHRVGDDYERQLHRVVFERAVRSMQSSGL